MGKYLKVGFAVLAVLALLAAPNAFAARTTAAGEDAAGTPGAVADEVSRRATEGKPPAPGGKTDAFQWVSPDGTPIAAEAADSAIRGAFGSNIVYPLKPAVSAGTVTLKLGQVDGRDATAPTDATEKANYDSAKSALEAALTSAIGKGRIDATSLANQEIPLVGGQGRLGLKADVDATGNVTAVYIAHSGHGRSEQSQGVQRGYLTADGVNFLASNNPAALEAVLVRELNLRQANPNATDAEIMADHTAEEKTALTSAGPAILAETQRRVTEALSQLRSTMRDGATRFELTPGSANTNAVLGANIVGAEPIKVGATGVVVGADALLSSPASLGAARILAEVGIPVIVAAEGAERGIVEASVAIANEGLSQNQIATADNAQAAIALLPVADVRYIRGDNDPVLPEDVSGKRVVSVNVGQVLANLGRAIQGVDAWFNDILLREQARTQK